MRESADSVTPPSRLPWWRRVEQILGVALIAATLLLAVRARFGPKAERAADQPHEIEAAPSVQDLAPETGTPSAAHELAGLFRVPLLYLALILLSSLILVREQKRLLDVQWWQTPRQAPPAWWLYDCLKVFCFFIVVREGLAGLVVATASDEVQAILAMLISLLSALYALAVIEAKGTEAVAQLGAGLDDLCQRLGLSLRAYLCFVPIFVAAALLNSVIVITIWLLAGRPSLQVQQEAVRFLLHPDFSLATRVGLWVFAVVGAPIAEEIVFRGLLYGALRHHMAWLPAALLSGVLFGLVHLDWLRCLPLILLGVFLAVLRERSRSLIVPIGVHALHNLAMLGLLCAAG